jgi:hypothetical protein
MPVHDWTRVDASVFHAFHTAWTTHLSEALNCGILPDICYARPEVHTGQSFVPKTGPHRRTLAIRDVSEHRLIAITEIVAPTNKDSARHVDELSGKIAAAFRLHVNVVLVDLFPPGQHDPDGMHGAVLRASNADAVWSRPKATAPLTIAAYFCGRTPNLLLESFAVGDDLPEMPLYLDSHEHIVLPLARTYDAAFRGTPEYWRNVLNE